MRSIEYMCTYFRRLVTLALLHPYIVCKFNISKHARRIEYWLPSYNGTFAASSKDQCGSSPSMLPSAPMGTWVSKKSRIISSMCSSSMWPWCASLDSLDHCRLDLESHAQKAFLGGLLLVVVDTHSSLNSVALFERRFYGPLLLYLHLCPMNRDDMVFPINHDRWCVALWCAECELLLLCILHKNKKSFDSTILAFQPPGADDPKSTTKRCF